MNTQSPASDLIDFDYAISQDVYMKNKVGARLRTSIVGCNNKRSHGLLICKLDELDGKEHVLLSALNEVVVYMGYEYDLNVRCYTNWNHTEGLWLIKDFTEKPIVSVTFSAGPFELIKEMVLAEQQNVLFVRYTLKDSNGNLKLKINPLTAFRKLNSLSRSVKSVVPGYRTVRNGISMKMYNEYPELYFQTLWPVKYMHKPDWYYNFEYRNESSLLDEHSEDVYTPGYFEVELQENDQFVFAVSLKELDTEKMPYMFINEMAKRKGENNILIRNRQTTIKKSDKMRDVLKQHKEHIYDEMLF